MAKVPLAVTPSACVWTHVTPWRPTLTFLLFIENHVGGNGRSATSDPSDIRRPLKDHKDQSVLGEASSDTQDRAAFTLEELRRRTGSADWGPRRPQVSRVLAPRQVWCDWLHIHVRLQKAAMQVIKVQIQCFLTQKSIRMRTVVDIQKTQSVGGASAEKSRRFQRGRSEEPFLLQGPHVQTPDVRFPVKTRSSGL